MFGTELNAITDAGAGLLVGTVDADGRPRGIRAWSAVVVDPDERRVRVVLSSDPATIDNLRRGRAAFNAADVRSLRCVQMKGRVVAVGDPTPADEDLTRAHIDRFFEAVTATDGNPLELLQLMLPASMVAFEMIVEEQFDQTPGPTAGKALP